MKRLFSSALAAIGLGNRVRGAPRIVTVDPKTVRYTMPTVAADDIQFVMPTAQTFDGAPQFHEDEWRQLEFYPASQLLYLQTRLAEYKVFEQRNRTKYGWNETYARRISGPTILPGLDAKSELAELLQATSQPSPILTVTSSPLGQVKDGFTLRLADTVFLYGLANSSGIHSLAAAVEQGGDDQRLTEVFCRLNKTYSLVFVDWRSQMILTSVGHDGGIDVWRP